MSRQHASDRGQEAAGTEAPARVGPVDAAPEERHREQSLAEIGRMYGGVPDQRGATGPAAPVQQSLAEIGRRYGGTPGPRGAAEQATGSAGPAVDPTASGGAHQVKAAGGASPVQGDATTTAAPVRDEPVLAAAPAGVAKHDGGADWGDPRERLPQHDFRGTALTRPEGVVQVPLGHRHRQAYWIGHADRAPEGTSYRWRHALQGSAAVGEEVLAGETAEGASHELAVRPRVPGKKKIATTAIQHGPGGRRSLDVDDVVLTTPVPKMGAPVLDSIGDKGRRPVLHTMDLGEDLLVTVRFELIDDDVDEIRPLLDSSTLSYKGARKVGPGELELRLHPAQPGKATGILRVAPMETSSQDVPPIKLDVTVEELKDPDDAGSRPRDVGGVRQRLEPVIAGIFQRRHNGIENVYKQEKEKDPPPATPVWKALLKHAVTIAINAVTAGLGAKIAGALISSSDEKPLTTELVKVLFEQTMSTGALAAVEEAFEGGDDAPGAMKSKRSGMRRAMGIMFHDAQRRALSAEEIVAKQRHLATLENKVKRLEAEKPDRGFREALRLEAELKKSFEIAEITQYVQTFQRWCSVLAANTLNTGKDDGSETNLEKSVDVDKVVRLPGEQGSSSEAVPGLSKTPGVLNLTLVENERVTVSIGGERVHPVKVERAAIAGLGSQDFRSTIKSIPLKELRMPIVASFSRYRAGSYNPVAGGFVIGRNEANQYWGSELGAYLSVATAIRMGKAGEVDLKEAAQHIIMNEIGDQKVEPEGA